MSIQIISLPPTVVPTPETVRRIKKMRAKKSVSLREIVLVKNAHMADKLKRLERRRQRAAARPQGYGEARYQATLRTFYEAEEADKASLPLSPTIPPSNIFAGTDDILLKTAALNSSQNIKTRSSLRRREIFKMSELDLEHIEGDVISLATDHSVIVHACNCIGAWGSGIALQLKTSFPAAYAIYSAHCKTNSATDLLGTCLLIPPQHADYNNPTSTNKPTCRIRNNDNRKPIWIACLFTSVGYGRGSKRNGNPGVSSKEEIVQATGTALISFILEWMDARERDENEGEENAAAGGEAKDKDDGDAETEEKTPDSAIFCPKFNAGSFGIPWATTEELIKKKWQGVVAKWTVVSR